MSAVEVLKAARAAGISVEIDDDDLVLWASAPPSAAVLELLSHYKANIVSLIRPGADGWSAEDWQAYFDERAGIAEFDRTYSRIDAEIIAFEESIDHWLALNPPASQSPDTCLLCGKEVLADYIEVARVAIPTGGPGRVHVSCGPMWEQVRRAEARARLIFLLKHDTAA